MRVGGDGCERERQHRLGLEGTVRPVQDNHAPQREPRQRQPDPPLVALTRQHPRCTLFARSSIRFRPDGSPVTSHRGLPDEHSGSTRRHGSQPPKTLFAPTTGGRGISWSGGCRGWPRRARKTVHPCPRACRTPLLTAVFSKRTIRPAKPPAPAQPTTLAATAPSVPGTKAASSSPGGRTLAPPRRWRPRARWQGGGKNPAAVDHPPPKGRRTKSLLLRQPRPQTPMPAGTPGWHLNAQPGAPTGRAPPRSRASDVVSASGSATSGPPSRRAATVRRRYWSAGWQRLRHLSVSDAALQAAHEHGRHGRQRTMPPFSRTRIRN